MIPGQRHLPMLVWAARDIQRRPGRSLLLLGSLASLVFIIATALLFSQALKTTWSHLLEASPDLVVRRIDAGGWAPLPMDAAMASVRRIPGVLDPTPRLWGIATAGGLPVTVVTAPTALPAGSLPTVPAPGPGQAVVGQALLPVVSDGHLTLVGRNTLTVTVRGTLPADTGLATHDLVWMAPADARRLLDVPSGHASDLAIRLFRREEAPALAADLATAFPWPVAITTRDASALDRHTRAARTGSLAMLVGLPAVLALLLIVTAVAAGVWSIPQDLLRAMGWSTADLLRLQMAGAVIVGLPAVTIGLAGASVAVFWPPAAGTTALWITGGQHLPALVLSRDGALPVMLEIAAMVGLPYLTAVFLTTLQGAAGEIQSLPQVDPWN